MQTKPNTSGWQIFLASALLLTACGKKEPLLPEVAVNEVPAPRTTAVVLKQNMLLRDVAEEAYGHERFYRFIMVANGLKDEAKIPAGKTIQTPSIAAAFRDAGLAPRYQPVINALAKAAMEFEAILPEYIAARNASGVSAGTFAIPKHIQAAFFAQADVMEAAQNILRKVHSPHEAPTITVQHLDQAVTWLRILAKGEIDGLGYDHDFVSQHTALSLSCAFVWMKEGYR